LEKSRDIKSRDAAPKIIDHIINKIINRFAYTLITFFFYTTR